MPDAAFPEDHAFVILEHVISDPTRERPSRRTRVVAGGPVHWDWLFVPPHLTERGSAGPLAADQRVLWTWATDPPGESLRGPFQAIRLPDHRVRYLSFEGDLSGGRGSVRQLCRGRYRPFQWDEHQIEIELIPSQSQLPALADPLRIRLASSSAEPESWQLRVA